jgi:luciferase family oxidoreductase group 1
MRLSVLDSSPVIEGANATDAHRMTARLARHTDDLGFHRFWVTELHGAPMNAGTTPEVTLASLASLTTRLRLGSGAVLLNHRNIFRTVETFQQLHAMFPGRIDLGIGRAGAGPAIDRVLEAGRGPAPNGYAAQLTELLGRLGSDHPGAGIPSFDGVPGVPDVWILGSTPSSAVIAAEFGLPYAFAGFLNPGAAAASMATYRATFSPVRADDEPRSLLALNVSCAPTPEAAASAGSSAAAIYAAAAGGVRLPRVPVADEASRLLGGPPSRRQYQPGEWPATLNGTPDQLAADLSDMAQEVGADEIMVQDFIADADQRLQSYTLLAEAFGLSTSGGSDA